MMPIPKCHILKETKEIYGLGVIAQLADPSPLCMGIPCGKLIISQMIHFQSHFSLMAWENSGGCAFEPCALEPCAHVGDLDETSGSWL